MSELFCIKRISKLFVFLFLLSNFLSSFALPVSAASSCTQTNWYNSAWGQRRKIVFDNSAQAENLTDFPVLVKLNSNRINYSATQDSGQDIRFTDSDGVTPLAYEIEQWNEEGDSFVWVKVPRIDSSSSTDSIYLYYGNTNASDSQNINGTWNSNYKAVWHMDETSGVTVSNSASNGPVGTKEISATEPAPSNAGRIDGAQSFDGTGDRVSFIPTDVINLSAGSVSLWVKPSSTQTDLAGFLFSNPLQTNNSRIYILVYTSGGFFLRSLIGAGDVVANVAVAADNWHNVALVWDGTTARFHVDGVDRTTDGIFGGLSDIGNTSYIGCFSGAGLQCATGTVDEVRISNIARSGPWIAAEYKSESDTFNSYSSEESYKAECDAPGPVACTDTIPASSPSITSLVSGSNSMGVNFSPASDPVSYYALEYGTKSGEYVYGASNIGGKETRSYTVNLLSPGRRYYFRVRAGNGCMIGPWSTEKSAVTLGGFYEPISTPKPTVTPLASPKPSEGGTPQPSPISEFRFPEFHFPKISLPIISLPQITLPTIALREFLANLAFAVGERAQDISDSLGYAIINFGYGFIKEPTKISEVKVAVLSPTSAKITWITNHPANSKINYGESLSYGQDVQSEKRVRHHELVIEDLEPKTEYFFEVMSQNKGYIFDAWHAFETPGE